MTMTKRRRPRAAVALAAIGVTVALSACSSDSNGPPSSGKEGGLIAYVPSISGSPFYETLACGVKSAVTKAGYKFVTQAAPKFDAGLQTQVIQALQQRDPVAMVIDDVLTKQLQAPLTALARRVPLVLSLEPATIPGAKASVLFDQVAYGRQQAQALVKKMGPTGQVFLLDYQAGSATLDQRYQGQVAELKKYSGIEVVAHQYAVGDPTKAAQQTSGVLQAHPGLTGVLTTDVYSTPGVVNAVKSSKKTAQVTIVSADAVPSTIAEVNDGEIYAFVAQKVYALGERSGQAAVTAAQGKKQSTKPEYVQNATTTITKDNIAVASSPDYAARTSC